MIRPEFLDLPIDFNINEGLFFMSGGKRHMIFWMPIFSEDDMGEEFLIFFKGVDVFEDFSTLRDAEASSFTEIVLNVNNYECS